MNERELELEAQKGERAERLLNDQLLNETINKMRETVFNNWRSSYYKDSEDRDDLYKMVKAIDHFEGELKRLIRDGKAARSTLAELARKIKSIF